MSVFKHVALKKIKEYECSGATDVGGGPWLSHLFITPHGNVANWIKWASGAVLQILCRCLKGVWASDWWWTLNIGEIVEVEGLGGCVGGHQLNWFLLLAINAENLSETLHMYTECGHQSLSFNLVWRSNLVKIFSQSTCSNAMKSKGTAFWV